jgi:hypothetical protein
MHPSGKNSSPSCKFDDCRQAVALDNMSGKRIEMASHSFQPLGRGLHPQLNAPAEPLHPQIPSFRELEHIPSSVPSTLFAPNLTTYIHHVRKLFRNCSSLYILARPIYQWAKNNILCQLEIRLRNCEIFLTYAWPLIGYELFDLTENDYPRYFASRSLHIQWYLYNISDV